MQNLYDRWVLNGERATSGSVFGRVLTSIGELRGKKSDGRDSSDFRHHYLLLHTLGTIFREWELTRIIHADMILDGSTCAAALPRVRNAKRF